MPKRTRFKNQELQSIKDMVNGKKTIPKPKPKPKSSKTRRKNA